MVRKLFFWFLSILALKNVCSQNNAICQRDYSQNCAEGWGKLSSTEECVSPLSYKGPCPRFLKFEKDIKKKKLLENHCSIHWPCMNECEKDYSLQCPEKWGLEDEKNCHPLGTYEGTCLLIQDFSNFTNDQKEMWSNKCATTWPCKKTCVKDYSKQCPQGWVKDNDGTCYAQKNYVGPCLSRASLINFDEDMKVAFEKLCIVNYPCLRNCKMDQTDPCPKNWILKSNYLGNPESCLPPDNYSGHCGEQTKFIGIDENLKETMEYECGIKWSCVDEHSTFINYEEFCPENWTKNGPHCIAPLDYFGPCSKKKIFEGFTSDIKKAYAEECDSEWPSSSKLAPNTFPKIQTLRKRKYNFGAVEPITGQIVSSPVI
ncbi:CPW-WPC family protein, putative [Plasmodium chabaudi adami]|uniref:CPW-WPC family protein, putative n=1 Tax=Plasmodium chabaudi adami TaxID=5826 RepID=A0A1C6XQI4_PLACE|nr:CPW-WPC family protein, putative [Plasmodium chabaudi adami]